MTGELWFNEEDGPSDNGFRTTAWICQAVGLSVCAYAFHVGRARPAHPISQDDKTRFGTESPRS
jgi:hypothetical protein